MAYPNSIRYPNLRAEMARRSLTIQDVAEVIGVNRDTMSKKLSGKSPLFLDEAFKIINDLFPDADIKNIFSDAASVGAN